jgi:hypothetical protein
LNKLARKCCNHRVRFNGTRGLDVNDPAQKYTLNSISGKFSGLHLLCIEYVGFQKIHPSTDLGFDLSSEYTEAMKIHKKH